MTLKFSSFPLCLPFVWISFLSSLCAFLRVPVCSSGLVYLVRLKLLSLWRTLTQSTSAWRHPTATLLLERRTCSCMCRKEPNVWDAYTNHKQIMELPHINRHLRFLQWNWWLTKTSLLNGNKSFAAQWHHIENLDLFFQRISFYMLLARMPYSECLWIEFTELWISSFVFTILLNIHHVYNLHQKNGFTCMLLGEIFELVYVFFRKSVIRLLSVAFNMPCFYVFMFLPLSPFFPHSQLLFVVGFTVFLANCVDYDILFANKFVNHTDSSKVTLPDAFIPMDVCSNRWVWCSSKVIYFMSGVWCGVCG